MTQLSFRNLQLENQVFTTIYRSFCGNFLYIYIYELRKKKLKDVNMQPDGLENTRIWIAYVWQSPQTLTYYMGVRCSTNLIRDPSPLSKSHALTLNDITLFRSSITMFCGTDNVLWNIPIFKTSVRIFHRILSVSRNIVMDMNNVMESLAIVAHVILDMNQRVFITLHISLVAFHGTMSIILLL